jgi:hypothetical protein
LGVAGQVGGGLGPAGDLELGQDAGDVVLDRLLGQAQLLRWWLAYRAMPADRLAIVGSLPWLDPLYLAVSHSGVTVAPVLGRLVAREVADGLLAPFRPGRFAERATRVMLEVESVFRKPSRQDRST